MSFTLLLNSSNVIGSNNNTFQYKFLSGNFTVPEGSEIAISQITIPYSWKNVSTNYNNKTFAIKWVNTGATSQTFTLPDGFYDIDSLNAYIQQICISNGWYLVDTNGNNYYYIVLSTNSNYYKIQLLLMNVPTSLPSGWTQPSNWAGYPVSTLAPQFTLNSSGSIASIIGFTAGGSWGYGTSSVSVLSTLTPNITQVNSLTVRCSLVSNRVFSTSDILDSIPINTTYGSNINYNPNYEKWCSLSVGSFNNLVITFVDQNLGTLYALDPNVSITLLIKFPKK